MVAIGVSTGGPAALERVLSGLDARFPVPVLVVQHMPRQFVGGLARRLDGVCALHVVEAADGEVLRGGQVWLAPGGSQMEAALDDRGHAVVRLHRAPSLNGCGPSVDCLFSSVARVYGAGTLAVVMTGMGADGVAGARAVHAAGGVVLAQDRATSAVWGMPGRVVTEGLAEAAVPLEAIAHEMSARVAVRRRGVSAARRTPVEEVAHGML